MLCCVLHTTESNLREEECGLSGKPELQKKEKRGGCKVRHRVLIDVPAVR